MRTIFINTLGRELTKNPLFFLPFREDHMFWLEQDLSEIDACAEEISAICNDQIKRQDYRLVVLADPVCFQDGEVDIARTHYEDLIVGLLNRRLLSVLVRHSDLIPKSVTVIFLVSREADGRNGITDKNVTDHIFGITAQDQPVQTLRITRPLPGGNLEHLDVTDLFTAALEDHHGKITQRAAAGESLTNEIVFDHLRTTLKNNLRSLQICSYVPTGGTKATTITIRKKTFTPKTTVPQLIWADLQLDLCDFLADQARNPSSDPDILLPAHTQEDLEYRISRARVRIGQLFSDQAPHQTYFPLVNLPRLADNKSLSGDIWEALVKEADNLPGVAETYERQDPKNNRKERPSEKLKRAWFHVGQEIKQFRELCTRLDSEYNEELVTEQQQTILDICAQAFRQWRSQALRVKLPNLNETAATETEMPELDAEKLRRELVKSQQACTRFTAEKLADYSDVRQEAEVIKARFRKASRFWSPDCGSANTQFFQIYSVVMALLFLAQIMLPYIGITLGQSGIELDRYAHFLLSIAVFAGLYCVGLLIWLRGLCDELHAYAEQMSMLIWKSGRRRADSIEAAAAAYSDLLPKCMDLNEDLRELEYIHAVNEARKKHYNAHMETLKKADELLQELATQLQLPDRDQYIEPEFISRGVDYHLPPSHGRNLPFYTLLSDEWGDPSC